MLIISEISSPNYPLQSESGQTCSYKLVSEPGSQISVNFLDMDLPVDATQTCSDFVQLIEEQNSASALIGTAGRSFCGQQLPNYPGPSVLISGILSHIEILFLMTIFPFHSCKLSDCQLPHSHDKLTQRDRIPGP